MSLGNFDWGGLWAHPDLPHFEFTPPSGNREQQARDVVGFFRRYLGS